MLFKDNSTQLPIPPTFIPKNPPFLHNRPPKQTERTFHTKPTVIWEIYFFWEYRSESFLCGESIER
ncbi:MAG: hypothetical protein ACD_71C00170G0005 [uncultured bacterium (gcode 4)]|uniref:Uncharacterized protein n=1 Tax=uncultured bacterium (gcode 4) TaxID=1234023 RepID=K1Z4Z0_9BACT|nr:MAG: hypothetical protein ACD_71C00170G0005 [uncultured bacterium (gcode 4)]